MRFEVILECGRIQRENFMKMAIEVCLEALEVEVGYVEQNSALKLTSTKFTCFIVLKSENTKG